MENVCQFSLCIHQLILCWFQILATVNSTAIHKVVQLSFYANTICLGNICRRKRAGSCDKSYAIHVYDSVYERGSTLFSAMALLMNTEPAVHRSSLSPAFHCVLDSYHASWWLKSSLFWHTLPWALMWNIFFLNYLVAWITSSEK